jgi:hypothetical protein
MLIPKLMIISEFAQKLITILLQLAIKIAAKSQIEALSLTRKGLILQKGCS